MSADADAATAATSARPTLSVQVRAGDLRGLALPLLVGQHEQDPIAGPQALIDQTLDGALSDRHRLGLYAGPIGTATVVLRGGQSDSEPLRGAVVTGLADAAHQERARDSGSASDSRVRRSRAPQTATSCISDTTRGPTVARR